MIAVLGGHHGKGGRQRMVPISGDLAAVLDVDELRFAAMAAL
jgi:hypothetical protein